MEENDENIQVELGTEIMERPEAEEDDDDNESETEIQEDETSMIRQIEGGHKDNICVNCGQELETKETFIEHIRQNTECLQHYGGAQGIEKLKIDLNPNEFAIKYQVDDNIACAPVVEDGCSKLDHSMIEDIRTLPAGSILHPSFFCLNQIELVDAFVGMTLSSDGESVEVSTLISRDSQEDLSDLMSLFHAIMAVLDSDLCSLTMFKLSPFILNNTGLNLQCLRNKFTNELIESEGKMPEPPETTCIPDKTRETMFLSESMELEIPYQQLLSNPNLEFRDMAAIGVRIRKKDVFEIRPIFSVNMSDDWRPYMKVVGTVLTSWYGNKDMLNGYFQKLPCFISCVNRFIYETYLDCLENLKKPPESATCKHCGLIFKYNSYLFKERAKFKHHESTHDMTCKHCGYLCESQNGKIYHMRTHKSIHFPCTLCIFVGSSQKSLDSHLKWKHVEAMCELCGKSFTCGANLNIHKTEVHKLKIRKSQKLGSSNEPKKFFCHICGKPYCSKQVLRKHMIKHNNEDSLVNKHMIEDPGEYKYKCSRHENCKKYFKTARYLKRHLNLYGDKPYPHKVHDSLIPTIPEGQKLITDQDKEFWDNLKSGLEEQVKKRLDKIQSIKPFPGSSVHVAKAVILPKTQLGLGAFPCHLCSKSYEKKATLEKHIAGHSRGDSTINRVMNEDPSEYKYMCTRHTNCKKYFKKARYLRNHLYKFANQPYPENAGAHYMPDIRPNQTFITDQDPELFDILNLEERKRKNREKKVAKKDPNTPILDPMKQEARPLYFVSN